MPSSSPALTFSSASDAMSMTTSIIMPSPYVGPAQFPAISSEDAAIPEISPPRTYSPSPHVRANRRRFYEYIEMDDRMQIVQMSVENPRMLCDTLPIKLSEDHYWWDMCPYEYALYYRRPWAARFILYYLKGFVAKQEQQQQQQERDSADDGLHVDLPDTLDALDPRRAMGSATSDEVALFEVSAIKVNEIVNHAMLTFTMLKQPLIVQYLLESGDYDPVSRILQGRPTLSFGVWCAMIDERSGSSTPILKTIFTWFDRRQPAAGLVAPPSFAELPVSQRRDLFRRIGDKNQGLRHVSTLFLLAVHDVIDVASDTAGLMFMEALKQDNTVMLNAMTTIAWAS